MVDYPKNDIFRGTVTMMCDLQPGRRRYFFAVAARSRDDFSTVLPESGGVLIVGKKNC